jgi:hypothetical protein
MLSIAATIFMCKNQRALCQQSQRVSAVAVCPQKDFIAIPQVTTVVSIDIASAAMQRRTDW